MKKTTIKTGLLFLMVICLMSCNQKENTKIMVNRTTSTQNSKWDKDIVLLDDIKDNSICDVEILLGQKEQTIDGFGACFNELGWDALNILDENKRNEILNDFFHPDNGFRFSICRLPLGANDYSREWHSFNEIPDDFDMENFSISRDKEILIPYIKKALNINPNIQLWASPWCPPSWMKTNKHYACRQKGDVNDLKPEQTGQEGVTQFIMDEKYLSAYALYFMRFIEAYKNEGIHIYATHVQNEPNSCQPFPSCVWTAQDLNTFIGKYLGPAYEKNNVNVEIWYGTIERPSVEKVDTVLQDPDSKKYVKGVGFQWAGKGAIPGVNEKYPYIKKMQTESECGYGENDWAAAEYTFGLMKHYLNNGANSYLYWNTILDETGKSRWGWKQNSLISVDSNSKKTTYNPEYYIFKHVCHFVDQGATKLKTTGEFNDILAFENPDGEIVIIAVNIEENSREVSVKLNKKLLKVQMPAKSFSTFKMPSLK